jgi:hypothetical protein
MSARLELIGELETGIQAAEKIYANYSAFKSEVLLNQGKNQWSAMIVTKLISDYYTCAESIFLGISQAFENHLEPSRWHSELLHKMTVAVPELRPKLFDTASISAFRELLAFRHFARYYFEMAYDWQKLDFLMVQLEKAHADLMEAVAHFSENLRAGKEPA